MSKAVIVSSESVTTDPQRVKQSQKKKNPMPPNSSNEPLSHRNWNKFNSCKKSNWSIYLTRLQQYLFRKSREVRNVNKINLRTDANLHGNSETKISIPDVFVTY